MRVVFMGTPEFAVPSLEQLIKDGHEVVGVFAQPDKPKGRGYKLAAPPVKEAALAHNIPVYQPVKMRDGEALGILKELDPEVIVVVAACKRLHQCSWLPAAEISRCRSNSVVCYQWRESDRRNHHVHG